MLRWAKHLAGVALAGSAVGLLYGSLGTPTEADAAASGPQTTVQAARITGTRVDVSLYGKAFLLDAGTLKDDEARTYEAQGHRLEIKRRGELLQLSLDGKVVIPASPESAPRARQVQTQCLVTVVEDSVAPFAGKGIDAGTSKNASRAGMSTDKSTDKNSTGQNLKLPTQNAEAGGCDDVPAADSECGDGFEDSIAMPRAPAAPIPPAPPVVAMGSASGNASGSASGSTSGKAFISMSEGGAQSTNTTLTVTNNGIRSTLQLKCEKP